MTSLSLSILIKQKDAIQKEIDRLNEEKSSLDDISDKKQIEEIESKLFRLYDDIFYIEWKILIASPKP